MIVVAGVGDQRFGERGALARNAAVDPGDILRRGPRDIAERTAGLDLFVFPAHAAEPQLGAPVVVWRILRVHKGGANRTASKQGLELEGGTTRIGGVGTNTAGDRNRDGRMN